jgi:diguanylate cyclase (GGDEF)-like protein
VRVIGRNNRMHPRLKGGWVWRGHGLPRRPRLVVPILVAVLTLLAFGAIATLIARADSSRRSQLRTASLTLALSDLRSAPFTADHGSLAITSRRIATDESVISDGLSKTAQPNARPADLATANRALSQVKLTVDAIVRLASSRRGLPPTPEVARLALQLTDRSAALAAVLSNVSRTDARKAAQARLDAQIGTAAALLLLLLVFQLLYVRSQRARLLVERLARENHELLKISRGEATTDALTGLGNRRALEAGLAQEMAASSLDGELLLAMFDLDGFKQYNDSFGHSAGDALLQRLGARLVAVTQPPASAYRMGGDEFCLLARCSSASAEGLLATATDALTDSGEGWMIGCSSGACWIPSEAATASDALTLADQRMYANKRSRSSASRQLTDVLLQVITEQGVELSSHVAHVADMSSAVATALGQPEHEVQRIHLAAMLHDVGKTAIPTAILNKPGPLDPEEWEFVRRHTAVGERIVLSAPALATAAPLVRSSHEWIDGKGYPDGLYGTQIPVGSRIIAVCDAFDAMTSYRPHKPAVTVDAALHELQVCAGTQFDAGVVEILQTQMARSSVRDQPQQVSRRR